MDDEGLDKRDVKSRDVRRLRILAAVLVIVIGTFAGLLAAVAFAVDPMMKSPESRAILAVALLMALSAALVLVAFSVTRTNREVDAAETRIRQLERSSVEADGTLSIEALIARNQAQMDKYDAQARSTTAWANFRPSLRCSSDC